MSTNSPTPKSAADYTGVTKWIVLGIVLIVAIVALKAPLERLVDRTQEVSAGSGGFTLKTTQTVIGEVNVSSVKVTPTTAGKIVDEPGYQKYVGADFMLSWPPGWMRDDSYIPTLAAQYASAGVNLDIKFYCRQEAINELGGSTNVYVVTSPYDHSLDFKTQVEQLKQILILAYNAQIISEDVDPATKGATLILNYQVSTDYGMKSVYQIQRYGYKNDQVIQVMASTMADDTRAREELRTILNSFRIVEG